MLWWLLFSQCLLSVRSRMWGKLIRLAVEYAHRWWHRLVLPIDLLPLFILDTLNQLLISLSSLLYNLQPLVKLDFWIKSNTHCFTLQWVSLNKDIRLTTPLLASIPLLAKHNFRCPQICLEWWFLIILILLIAEDAILHLCIAHHRPNAGKQHLVALKRLHRGPLLAHLPASPVVHTTDWLV